MSLAIEESASTKKQLGDGRFPDEIADLISKQHIPFASDAARNGKRVSVPRSMAGPGNNTPVAANRLSAYKSNSRSKWVTREIAALEFLLGIPLEAEQEIVKKGWMQQQGIVEEQTKAAGEDEKMEILEPPTQQLTARSSSNVPRNQSHHGRWWEKWINNPKQLSNGEDLVSGRSRLEDDELELPHELGFLSRSGRSMTKDTTKPSGGQPSSKTVSVPVVHAPGRRLQGDEATKIHIPTMNEVTVITKQKNIARMAFTREWEIKLAHGIGDISNNPSDVSSHPKKQVRPPLLDGRLFFSAGESYPMEVFSLLRYEPKKEEAARRRQKLEARGGGGTQFFIMPIRDWRGISYRALLPAKPSNTRRPKKTEPRLRFDRFASSSSDNMELQVTKIKGSETLAQSADLDSDDLEDGDLSDESDDEDTYIAGLLDDPDMVQGRHRNVMIGDRVTGPVVSSTIQFVKPELLKADLNKQFRERFDGWEPPKSQRKYIGARVVDGIYTLMDSGTGGDDGTIGSTGESSHQQTVASTAGTSVPTIATPRKRQGSVSSMSTGGDPKETIRMPPSLTLSKIRNVKRQALLAAVTAKLEISTVALSIVYFERLCLDCRVDKTNRRLSFAACLLLALKMNEAHVELVMTRPQEKDPMTTSNRIQSLIRPAKKSGNVFASLLEFFTQEWSLSLKHLFAAEWGVFAALQFRLHAKPSQVAFHFKRLLKTLDWSPRAYLGPEMYAYWIDSLSKEEFQRREREEKMEARQAIKERKKITQLQRELDAANRSKTGSTSRVDIEDRHDKEDRQNVAKKNRINESDGYSPVASPMAAKGRRSARGAGIGRILNHFSGGKRALSSDKLMIHDETMENTLTVLKPSPSMPTFPSDDVVDNIFVIDILKGGDISEPPTTGRDNSDIDDDADVVGIIV